MNILFLNSLSKSKWGGGEKWMIHAGHGLSTNGHKVTIACIRGSVIEKKSLNIGLDVWDYNIPIDVAYWKMAPLKSYLINNEINVLICCQNKDVRIGARAAKKIGIKAIFAREGLQNITNKKKYIKPFTQFIDGIITNTLSIKKIYEGFGWFPENFIHVIYNGIKIPSNIEDVNLYDRYQIAKDEKIIFSSGRLDYQKGFDLLIEVAKMAKKNNFKWRILIAGTGKIENELIALAEKKGVSDRVNLIGFSNEIFSILKACDVFVLPSRYEGMPNALLEAMAMGKASVATNVNGAPELVEDGKSGFLVESEDTNQIFLKLKEILADEKLKISMGKEAKERVKKHFTVDKMTSYLESLFEQTLKKKYENS